MNGLALLRLALGEPNEAEALKGISGLAALPGALAGMALALALLVTSGSSVGVVAGAMAGGGLCGGLIALGFVKAVCRWLGFASVAWIPLSLGGAIAGLGIEVAVGQIWWSWDDWVPFGVVGGVLTVAGIICTYRLRDRRPRNFPERR